MDSDNRAVAEFERFSDLLGDEGVRPAREFAELLRGRAREECEPLLFFLRRTPAGCSGRAASPINS